MKANTNFNSIEAYHQSLPQEKREMAERMYAIIKAAAPQATEHILYQMPSFKLGRNLVHYAVQKNHLGFYPAPSAILAFQEELRSYKTSKGAVQFPLDKQLPVTLIKKMVKFRVKEESERVKFKK